MNVRVPPILRLTLAPAFALAFALLPSSPARGADDDDFIPPSSSLPAQRTGGASRSGADVKLSVLAPADSVGRTAREHPVIYWYISADTDKPIEISVNDMASKETVADTELKGPTKAGVHKFDLAQATLDGQKVKLKAGSSYEVIVTVINDDKAGSKDPTATCRIQRLDPKNADAPNDAAKESDPAKRAAAYGKAGLWFDYLDALNEAIEKKPNDDALLQKRAKALAKQRLIWKPDGTITEERKADAKQ
jgi:hypothetical protein